MTRADGSQTDADGFELVTPASAPFVPWRPASPTPEEVLAGELDMQIAVIWQSGDRGSATGYWRCQPVRLRLTQAFEETLHLVEGHISYERDGRPRIDLRPEDSVVLRQGAQAIFEVHEPSMTFWAIFGEQPLQF